MKSLRYSLPLSLCCLIALPAEGRQRTQTELLNAARTVLDAIPAAERQAAAAGRFAPVIGGELMVLRQDSATSVVGYAGGMWSVVGNDDLLPEVLGYSATAYDPISPNPNLKWWMDAMEATCRDLVRRNTPKRSVAPDPSLYEPEMEAMVTSRWGQEAPYWNLCPTGTTSSTGWGYEDNTSGRCVTGCVATAMAQVLYYHNFPASGVGTHSVSVKQADGSYQTYTVDYESVVYDWANMLDDYSGGYSDEEAEAVATLMLHCGVATDMIYATDGSGAYMSNCTKGLSRNFGFESVTNPWRASYSEDQWMEMVYTELNEGRPIIYAGDDTWGGGHCFVLDGYDTKGFVHINWGWDGSGDGCFDIALLNVGSYQFSKYQEMVIGVQGNGQRQKARTDTLRVEVPGTLSALIDPVLRDSAYKVAVEGQINAADIATLRALIRHAGARQLDLRCTTIVDEALADSAFALCSSLSKLVLPRGLKNIGKKALAGCSHLSELRIYDRELPKLGTGVFNDVPVTRAHLYVPAATKEKYKRAAQWRAFGDANDNIYEFGTAFTVRNLVREQGKPNPVLSYTMVGDAVDGEPELSCEATEESPVGRYPITITRGSIINQDVDLVDGYLIVTESTQGISEVRADGSEADETLYDLYGRRVSAGSQRGICVRGGRKVVVCQ